MSLSSHQQIFIDKTIKNDNVRKCISSPQEYEFKKILHAIGKENEDWFHNCKPFVYEEKKLVAIPDFVFPKEKLIIELDGENHRNKKQRERDVLRDSVFYFNDYRVIRIKVPIPKGKESYWKVYIKEVLKICIEDLKKKGLYKEYE